MPADETPPGRPAPTAETEALVRRRLALWNGDLSVADEIFAEDFVAHAAPLTGSGSDEIRGSEALKEWDGGHALLPDPAFTVDVGPIFEDDYFVIRWARDLRWQGFPGAAQEAIGRAVAFTGTDTLRVEASKLAEYRANADSLLFVQQLGARHGEAIAAVDRPRRRTTAAGPKREPCPPRCSDPG